MTTISTLHECRSWTLKACRLGMTRNLSELQAGALSNRRSRLEAWGLGLLGHAVWDFKRISIYLHQKGDAHQTKSGVIFPLLIFFLHPPLCFFFFQHSPVPFINVHYLHRRLGETSLVFNIFQLLAFKAGPWFSPYSIITGAVNLYLLTYMHNRKPP